MNSLALLAMVAAVSASGDESTKRTPLQFALWNPVQVFSERPDVHGLRLDFGYSENRDVFGLDLEFVNDSDRAAGLEIGAMNYREQGFDGLQIGGLNFVNRSGAGIRGLRIGLLNFATEATSIEIGLVNLDSGI